LAFESIVGVLLGCIGSLIHLWVTHRRTIWLKQRHEMRALAALPLSLAGPVVAFFMALGVGQVAAWSTLIGMIVTHRIVLWRVQSDTREPSP
jgi:NhaP-type Na+/H+ or K+/H+ antiporter